MGAWFIFSLAFLAISAYADDEDQREILDQKCINGDASSCHILGIRYFNDGNTKKFRDYLSEGCKLDYMKSCHLLGQSLIKSGEEDIHAAKSYFSKACAQKHNKACKELTDYFKKGYDKLDARDEKVTAAQGPQVVAALPPAKPAHNLQVKANPLQIGRVNKSKDISYGLDYSYSKEKSELALTYDRFYFSQIDPIRQFGIKSATHEGRFTYDLNRFWGNLTYFFMVEYYRKQLGEILTTGHELRSGPFGLKYYFIDTDRFDMNLSYIPLFEYLVEDVEDLTVSTAANRIFKTVTSTGIRNSVRLRMIIGFMEGKLKLSESVFYRPLYNLDQNKIDWNDIDFEATTKLVYSLNYKFSVSMANKMTWNIRDKRIHHIPSTDMENIFQLIWHSTF